MQIISEDEESTGKLLDKIKDLINGVEVKPITIKLNWKEAILKFLFRKLIKILLKSLGWKKDFIRIV